MKPKISEFLTNAAKVKKFGSLDVKLSVVDGEIVEIENKAEMAANAEILMLEDEGL